MVDFRFYDPGSIFEDDGNPKGMAGKTNAELAVSFYHSRSGPESPGHKCNNAGMHERYCLYDRNAGGVQLYKEDGITVYRIPGYEEKEYHFMSYGNKYFKEFTGRTDGTKRSSYGHSERVLMRDILDDLISADTLNNHEILRPSDKLNSRSSDGLEHIYEVLRKLTNEPAIYKKYLESKNVIVKMWSERPVCRTSPDGGIGGGCAQFVESICPKGSQFGWIVKDYVPADNQDGAPKVREAFQLFEKSCLNYLKCNVRV